MIINSGIKYLVTHQSDGKLKKYEIKKWAEDWTKKDLIDDKQQYGVKTVKN